MHKSRPYTMPAVPIRRQIILYTKCPYRRSFTQRLGDNKYLLREKNVALCLDGLELTVYTDEKWVRFILGQLIANAVQYCNAQPTLSFYARREESQIRLTIQDNGLGIPEEELPRVFDKGFTGRNGRLRSGATGLGLYLCKQLCIKLGIGPPYPQMKQGPRSICFFMKTI